MKRDALAAVDLGWKPKPREFGVIERGVPIPDRRATGRYQALAEQMQPGDSVLFETANQAHVMQEAMRKLGHKTRRAKDDGGHRVWRVA